MPSVKADLKKEAMCVQHTSLVAYAFYPPVLATQKNRKRKQHKHPLNFMQITEFRVTLLHFTVVYSKRKYVTCKSLLPAKCTATMFFCLFWINFQQTKVKVHIYSQRATQIIVFSCFPYNTKFKYSTTTGANPCQNKNCIPNSPCNHPSHL